MFAWLTANIQLVAIAAVALIAGEGALLYTAYNKGETKADKRCEAQQEAARGTAEKLTRDLQKAQDNINVLTEERINKQVEATQAVTKTNVQEVTNYVTPAAVKRCPVPSGFVRLHNLSASGHAADAKPAPESVDSASGVGLDTAAKTIIENYGKCQDMRQKLIQWQTWYPEQQRKWDETRATLLAGHK